MNVTIIQDDAAQQADALVNAAAMPHDGDRQATTESTRDATQNLFEKAGELWCESILIPIPGIGVVGFDVERGVELICSVIAEHKSSTLTDARVIAYSDSEYESLQSVADTIQD